MWGEENSWLTQVTKGDHILLRFVTVNAKIKLLDVFGLIRFRCFCFARTKHQIYLLRKIEHGEREHADIVLLKINSTNWTTFDVVRIQTSFRLNTNCLDQTRKNTKRRMECRCDRGKRSFTHRDHNTRDDDGDAAAIRYIQSLSRKPCQYTWVNARRANQKTYTRGHAHTDCAQSRDNTATDTQDEGNDQNKIGASQCRTGLRVSSALVSAYRQVGMLVSCRVTTWHRFVVTRTCIHWPCCEFQAAQRIHCFRIQIPSPKNQMKKARRGATTSKYECVRYCSHIHSRWE